MIRLITVAIASLLALALTGCGESDNKPAASTTTVTTVPADNTQPAQATVHSEEQKSAE